MHNNFIWLIKINHIKNNVQHYTCTSRLSISMLEKEAMNVRFFANLKLQVI